MSRQGILVVISGFSGAGKGTLIKELMKRYDQYALYGVPGPCYFPYGVKL